MLLSTQKILPQIMLAFLNHALPVLSYLGTLLSVQYD